MTERSGTRVFITGSGALSGCARSVGELWNFACNNRRIRGSVAADDELAALIGLSAGDQSILGRHQLLALAVAEQAWSSAGLTAVRNRLRGEGCKESHPARACVGGSSLGGLVAMEGDLASSGGQRFSPYAVSRWRGNAVPAVVALRHGLAGPVLSLSAASATGAQLLWTAATLIRGGMAEIVVAVAADSLLSDAVARAMSRTGSVARDSASSPLSANRSGMIPAEGAAALILESEASVNLRGVQPFAEWLGGGIANECHHMQAPDPSGVTLERLIGKVMRESSVESPDWVSLHATGTPRYDAVECSVLARRPWKGGGNPLISAFKGITGHALSASGLLEAALLAEGLRRGETPPPPGDVDASLGLMLGHSGVPVIPGNAIQIAQGMGGDVVVNLLGRPGA